MANPVMRDIGIAFQYELFCRQREAGTWPIVVDSAILLQAPEMVLTRLCALCGLGYEQRMAHWPAGPKSYDGVWAPYWYANAHRSTGFAAPSPAPSLTLAPHLKGLHQDAQRLYEKLRSFSLKA